MPHQQTPGMSPFRAVKATLDGVTSAPFATYHILTCIGLIAVNHLLADHREDPRRVRLEERRKRDEKWRREDEEDERLDRMMKKANEIPHITRMTEGVTSYRETYGGRVPVHGDGPPPPFHPFPVPPRRAQTYTPNVSPPLHRDDPVPPRFPPPPPPGPHYQTCRPSPPGDQDRKSHHPPPHPRQQPYTPGPPIGRDTEYHHHPHELRGSLGQGLHYHHPPPPAFLCPRYGISKAYAEKLEAKAREQWTRDDGLTAVQKGDAWERMRDVKAIPIRVMNERVGGGGRGERKRVRWGGSTTREFVSEDEVLR